MPLQTTVIGAWPKPKDSKLTDWFMNSHNLHRPDLDSSKPSCAAGELKLMLENAIKHQKELGIDVITDGEVSRDCYVYHLCRQLDGIDCDKPEESLLRNGALKSFLPVITGKIQRRADRSRSVAEWDLAQETAGDTPVKYTLPGPMTICGTTKNHYYNTVREAAADCALAIREEVLDLVKAGCTYIQIDEPLLMREPENAKSYGFSLLNDIVAGLPDTVHTTLHLCCGYPSYLDHEGYLHADTALYENLSPYLNDTPFNALSIEDGREHIQELGSFLESITRKQVVLGCIAIAKSRIESVEEIKNRLSEALKYIPAERLIVAPDCGLGFLPPDILNAKISNMVAAAKQLPKP